MKVCMTYSTSTISTTLGTDMLILVSKPTECAAECMITLSKVSCSVLIQFDINVFLSKVSLSVHNLVLYTKSFYAD